MSWAENTKLRFQMFALMAVVGCPIGIGLMVSDTKRQLASNSWEVVEGEVQETIAKPWYDEDDNVTKYYGRAVYLYVVQGKEYKSDLTDLGPGTKRREREAALEDVSQYQPGMKVPVHYDPDDPSIGILATGIPSNHLVLLIGMSILFVVSSITSFFTIRGWLAGRKKKKVTS